jgi:hypothetical protein
MRRLSTFSVILFSLVLVATTTQAAQCFWNVSQSPGDSYCGNLACSRGSTVLIAWTEGGSQIWTRSQARGVWQGAVYHGAGDSPTMAWGATGVVLAYVSGSQIVIVEGNGTAWNPALIVHESGAVQMPSVWCSGDAGSYDAYLVWMMATGEVRFMRRSQTGWTNPELVYDPPTFYDMPCAVARPTLDDGQIVPRVYFFNQSKLKYSQLDGITWSAPVTVPTLQVAGSDLDVAVGSDMRHHILSLAPQPS